MRYKIILIFFFTALTAGATAQDTTAGAFDLPGRQGQRLNVVKTSPFSMLLSQMLFTGEARIMYERVTAPDNSVVVAVSYNYLTPLLTAFDTTRFFNQLRTLGYRLRGFRVQAGYRFYLTHDAPKGLYVGPHLSYNMIKFYNKDTPFYYDKIAFANANFLLGYQFLIDFLAIDIYTGIGYRYNYIEYADENSYGAVHVPPGEAFSDIPWWDSERNPVKFSFSTNFGIAF